MCLIWQICTCLWFLFCFVLTDHQMQLATEHSQAMFSVILYKLLFCFCTSSVCHNIIFVALERKFTSHQIKKRNNSKEVLIFIYCHMTVISVTWVHFDQSELYDCHQCHRSLHDQSELVWLYVARLMYCGSHHVLLTCHFSLYRDGQRDQPAPVKHGQPASVTSSAVLGKVTAACSWWYSKLWIDSV